MQSEQRGFSLMELMVAVAVAGILLAVAVPSYQNYLNGNRRAVAGACLVELSQFMERVYTTSMVYNLNNGVATALPATTCQQTLNATYTFDLSVAAQSYTISAAPKGAQSGDTACGTLTINEAGVRSAAGDSTPDQIKKCWG
ncbi:MAG: type IV pilin protein [Rheinheimera sp.]|nr:MAG: type IV pilin protein [Rheinheimera sp.]